MCVPGLPQFIGFNRGRKVLMVSRGKRFESNELAFKQSYVGEIHVLSLAWPNTDLPLKDKAGLESSQSIKGRLPLAIWGRTWEHAW